MARFNRPAILVLVLTLLAFTTYYVFEQQKYSLSDLSSFLETMDIGSVGGQGAPATQPKGKITNNNDPDILQKHKIEIQVNELLQKKLENELKYERESMDKKNKQLQEQNEALRKEKTKFEQENKSLSLKVQEAEKGKPVTVYKRERYSEEPSFIRKTFTFKTNPEFSPDVVIDGDKNEVVILASIIEKFDQQGQPFQRFLKLLQSIEYPHYKTSISLLISDNDEFKKFDEFVTDIFNKIEEVKDTSLLKDSFSKITLINADFIESQFKVDKGLRHDPRVQKKRRKLLAQIRNFLVFNGIGSEIYSLALDSDVIELPKNMLETFIESKKDIATIRIDIKNHEGKVVHQDYDLNSWAGDRRVPNAEQDAKLDTDPDFFYEPGPGPNNIQFSHIDKNLEKFGINKDDPKAAIELNSVGGAVLFVKTEVFKQGIMFPPFYLIGTKWNRNDGFDGIETEGLCYQAKTIGYKCWGFPNLVGFHAVG
ncbi:glycosyltransferase family 62 protein [Wickerhamomyces anomalus NRRL Y-366-8]|uniref:Glycosyltransferase family 62 protein n=1 Tax=Wickerhamomyces anomalus (strain ATCC 58044 / CBS 1984 / NCYC 433 / NRRL Y-366-8) TaxID=683960 RepID=A0A1E3NXF7_WICAA|nr:glycosyltransferase family 62 protein [Wickerhamomyces anomalus NRRL Y-366-8]ODQ57227.1 glycosyltransferase family 62 protein [Wickerhamomyces anomalus NRRL Y-366-8]